jgi:hypothetical protein
MRIVLLLGGVIMGFRYRKSINLGGGFRVNISKSGVGYSWGVKGARITKTSKGTTRHTLSLPGTGISYVNETGKGKNNRNLRNGSNSHQNNPQNNDVMPAQSMETVKVSEYQPVEYKELLDSIKKVQDINLVSTILLFTFLLSAVPIFILTGIAGIVLKIYTHSKLAIPMEYDFDEDSRIAYEQLNSTWMSMNANKKFWQIITAAQIQNSKAHGGAKTSVTRIPAKAINKVPYFLKLNMKPFGLQLKKKQLFFLPDKLLVVDGRRVGALNYSDINLTLGTTNFIESEAVPADAKVVRHTWLKVNKDGSPDRRYKGNRQVPVCEYGEVIIQSKNALYVEIMCSNSQTIETMRSHASKVLQIH